MQRKEVRKEAILFQLIWENNPLFQRRIRLYSSIKSMMFEFKQFFKYPNEKTGKAVRC